MADRSLEELEARRDRLYEQLAEVGDFRRGSVSENYRKCGKPNCACAQPDHPGHGPRTMWTRSLAGQRTRGRQLAAEEVDKVRGEIDNYAVFARLSDDLVEINEAICEARPPDSSARPVPRSPTGDEKGGSSPRSPTRSPPTRPPKSTD